jgi:hypothetical protein
LTSTGISAGTSNLHTNVQGNSVFNIECYQTNNSNTLKVVQIIKTTIYSSNAPSVVIIILKLTQLKLHRVQQVREDKFAWRMS